MRDDRSLRLLEYIYNSTSILNFGALFSDGTENYCSPSEPEVGDDLTLRFRTAVDNVDGVFVVVNDDRYEMKVAEHDMLFDYYEVVIPPVMERTPYIFEISAGGGGGYFIPARTHIEI